MAFFPSPFLWTAYFSFYTNLYPFLQRPRVGLTSKTDTCPISPYLKWLGVVAKTEEYGPVRCRVFNGSNDSFPFVLGRHTVQGSFFYQRRYFRFFPKLFLYRPCPFFQVGLRDAKDKVILGYVSRLLGLLLYVFGYIPHRLRPWIPM